MSYTGKVHEGDQSAGDEDLRILVVTESSRSINDKFIQYHISKRKSSQDFRYGGRDLKAGTPVLILKDSVEPGDMLINGDVVPLASAHLLYHLIKEVRGREEIRDLVAEQLRIFARTKRWIISKGEAYQVISPRVTVQQTDDDSYLFNEADHILI